MELLLPPTPEPYIVHVMGAVQQPGVYSLPAGSRALQAVQAAGGFSDEANEDGVNLAAPLIDGMKLVIPAVGETVATEVPVPLTDAGGGAVEMDPVNLNTATEAELMSLPNIGETRAKAIIQYREDYGPFAAAEDLVNVAGIGVETYETIKEWIVVK
ncbi:MAG TPA: helix-hairpin-helix domain-containing protein [Anaerolineaceae bacterium]|nr:helix-hairpin-helix domain-containing protein [Anaerolineaceae bacterium]